MKTMKNKDERLSRRDFLKRAAFGTLSIASIAAFGTSLFISCQKDSDEDDLAEWEEENKRKKEQENKGSSV